jgi:hypothetical protein
MRYDMPDDTPSESDSQFHPLTTTIFLESMIYSEDKKSAVKVTGTGKISGGRWSFDRRGPTSPVTVFFEMPDGQCLILDDVKVQGIAPFEGMEKKDGT